MSETMTATRNAVPGINAEKLAGFANFAGENPSDVLLTAKATSIWTGHAGHSTAKVGEWAMAGQAIVKEARDYTFNYGAWKEVEEAIGIEGADDKLEPVEGALAAMCACVNWAICLNAANEGISFDELRISASADIDPRVLVGSLTTDEATSLMQRITLNVQVRGENLSESDRVRIEDSINRSPVHAMVKYANSMATTVTVA